ncbi:NAD(P)/FAD-dependent oxidoreductase [Chelativorans salis]|uniref:FAD-dependent oxidoreductase n=1 Tax=Chelativorans salis TaxID=2978478 RepID=A0ABT2LQM5_9HYPH|nr:FAD-dependent oxidoreductase [Chelativorans sp. EGI FJ00035]MCT7376734.1 FAD-dependent oxidoreductase [Chelativorans sp. EGI FJ00035]
MSSILIVGGSHAGVAAASALRAEGCSGAIKIIAQEPTLPYHRPQLSKEALREEVFDPQPLRVENFYEKNGLVLLRGATASQLHLKDRCVVDANGQCHDYETLILACGASPRKLPEAVDPERRALYLRNFDDLRALKVRLASARSMAVVGGGLIGLEVAAVALVKGVSTTLLEAGERIMQRSVSRSISNYLADRHSANGLDLRLGTTLASIGRQAGGEGDVVVLEGGETLSVDLTVVAIGIAPNDGLARQAGLPVADGILASEQGCTTDPAVFAIGDCAAWLDPVSRRHIRYEAVNPGQEQAKMVAAAIAGRPVPALGVPRYWTHQGAMNLQMAGDVHGVTKEFVLKAPESGAFSVLGFQDDRLVAVQTVNAPRQFMPLYQLIGTDRDHLSAELDWEFPPPHHH